MEQLSAAYWEDRYRQHQTGWDLGAASPPLCSYVDQYANKKAAVLIPGCGNAHEALYLLSHGFTNITLIDIAPTPVQQLRQQLGSRARVLQLDFFEHQESYDLILEQTFFCALNPSLRPAYVQQMHRLLNNNGTLAGVLFDRSFEGGPPFGGSRQEYEQLFTPYFRLHTLAPCYNSIQPRMGTELFIIAKKKNS